MAWSMQRKVCVRISAPMLVSLPAENFAERRMAKTLAGQRQRHDRRHLFHTTEVDMIKMMSIFAATALALSLSGVAFSANTQDQPNTPKTQDQSNTPRPQDPSSAPPDQAKQDQDYLVALKRCEEMQDVSKQKCIDKAKQKYNHM